MSGPWEKYQNQGKSKSGWETVDESPKPANGGWQTVEDPYAAFSEPVSKPASSNWQDNLKPFRLPNGSQTVQRPDGAVYIKEANDPRFKGQEGWHVFDPKTGVWAPATPEDASAYGTLARNGVGIEGLKSWGRNMVAGLTRPGDAVSGLVAKGANTIGLLGDETYQSLRKELEDRERYRQALQNTSGTGAGFTQFTGEMLPAAAMTALAPEAAPTVFANPSAMAPTASTFVQRASANALAAAPTAFVATPGSSSDRVRAALAAMVAAPAGTAVGEGLAWVGGKAINSARALGGKGIPNTSNLNKDLLSRVSGEPTDVVKADLLSQQEAGRSAAREAYGQVKKIAGDDPLPFSNLLSELEAAGADLRSSAVKTPGIQNLTSEIRDSLGGADMDKSFTGALRLRSHLGELAAEARDANNRALSRTYENLRSAVTKDMDAFAARDGSGKLAEAYRFANDTFKSEVVPFFENPEIRRQIKAPFPDETVGRLVKAGPDRVGSVVAKMGPEGRAAFQAHLSDSAMKDALDANGDFIPGRFIKAMKDRQEAYNLTFKGEDKWRMDGFVKLMKAAKLVGDALPTGKLSHMLDTSVLAQKLFTTKPGQALLLSSSSLPLGSEALENLISSKLPRVLGVGLASQGSTQPEGPWTRYAEPAPNIFDVPSATQSKGETMPWEDARASQAAMPEYRQDQ